MKSDSLYLERWTAGHKKGCDLSIPELRNTMFTKCSCKQLEIEHNNNLDNAEIEYLKRRIKNESNRI